MTDRDYLKDGLDLETYRTAITLPEALRLIGIRVGGSRKILCPFHEEQEPSCHVYDDHLHCSESATRFDLIDLVGAVKGIGFWEALDWIAEQSGLPKPRRDPDAQRIYEATRRISAVTTPARASSIWVEGLRPASLGQSFAVTGEGGGIPGESGELKVQGSPMLALRAKLPGFVPCRSVEGFPPRGGKGKSFSPWDARITVGRLSLSVTSV